MNKNKSGLSSINFCTQLNKIGNETFSNYPRQKRVLRQDSELNKLELWLSIYDSHPQKQKIDQL